jgi:hypothetical protein
MTEHWPFTEPRNVRVYCTRGIVEGGKPVLLVVRDLFGAWQFLDGGAIAPGELPVHVQLGQVVALDPTLAEIADLPGGWSAERIAVGTPWSRAKGQEG